MFIREWQTRRVIQRVGSGARDHLRDIQRLRRINLKSFYAAGRVRQSLLSGLLFNYFDEIRQFSAGIEVYPFAGFVQIGQAPVFLALNPDQFLENRNWPAGLAIIRV